MIRRSMEEEQRQQLGGNPDWMSRLPGELLDVPLWNLALPGSHDSMSFCLDVSSPVLRSESCLLRVVDRLFPCWTRPCVFRWATTQQSVLSDQCDLGIRFLDLRIARKPAGGRALFFAHGLYTLMAVKEALDELAAWLDAHPKEVVIVSCSHFDSLTDEDHARLVENIITLFGDKLCSSKVCRQPRPEEGDRFPRGPEAQKTTSWFLRQRPEPDRRRPVRPPPSPPDHEEDDDEGPHVAAELGERAAAGARGRRGQHRLLRLCGRQSVLLARDRPELQAASRLQDTRRRHWLCLSSNGAS
ncbi:PI-PLC X domain-containing protein 1-like isoform X3 [Hippoglossus hippoglossus]|uniref:PI-PLC X domain-containing protein 1-like isoform X3 n=1 Tax=Hippoglossus hippoglossus TaxID=8267 RepID=UPI00148DF259|nr:PI-PLC X domain-containing protein 1-like isoform X3 [Hippoglossus hippoglossus]